MDNSTAAAGHVKFSEEDTREHTNEITLQTVGNNSINAHVGFLKLNHKYSLKISLPSELSSNNYSPVSQPSLAVKNVTIESKENESQLTILCVDFFAYKQKLLKEKVILNAANDKNLTITLCARVLGPNQGTPMLRDGITLLEAIPFEESEASDWQGFD